MQRTKQPYILFVDDEDMTRKMFERIAGREFDVLMADSVPAAKTLLDAHADEIGVLLTDQRMPGQLGVDLLEYSREAYPSIVRMLTTAYSDLADAIAAVNRGEIIRYIEKPWNNIDALLIDLRVAMRFHLLELENDRLMNEKLNAGAAISRMDRVRSIIVIASAQNQYSQRMPAVESMLRDLASLESVQNPLDSSALAEIELFGQPVSDTEAAIEVVNALRLFDRSGDDVSLQDLETACSKLGVKLSNNLNAEQLAGDEIAHLYRFCIASAQALMDANPESVEVSLEHAESGWTIRVQQTGEVSGYLGDWFSGLSMEKGNLAIGSLLQAHLSASALNAKPEVQVVGNGVQSISLSVSANAGASANDSAGETENKDLVDDILLLYS